MTNAFDLAAVLAIVAVAGVYLFRRYKHSRRNPGAGCGCGCDTGCGGCDTASRCDSTHKDLQDRELPRA